MKQLLIIAALLLSATAHAKAPPVLSGSCNIKGGIITGHCQVIPPVKIPTTPKPKGAKK